MNRSASDETVHYTIQPSPVGQLLIAAVDADIVRVAFQNQNVDDVLAELQTQYGGSVLQDDRPLAVAVAQIEEYFSRSRQGFDLPVRPAMQNGFRQEVQGKLHTIPYGQTRSYGEFANQVGRPGAARAIGSACATNPVPLIRPCHRVIRSDGSIGEYIGTTAVKNYLLAFERGETPDAPTC